MERVDVSMVYTHVIWYFVFTIYLNTILFAVYSIWTDLKSSGVGREDFIMALLVSLWCGLAYGLWTATERFA
jgi:hypothetical protein